MPDGALNLAQTYIQRSADLDREPDEELAERLLRVLRTAGYEFNGEST